MGSARYLQAAQIAAAQRGFQTVFNSVHSQVEDPAVKLAMEVSSQAGSEEYDWFDDVPGMQRWKDSRPLSKLQAAAMTIVNNDHGVGIEVHKNDILDDKLQKIRPKIQKLAIKAKLYPGLMLGRMLLNGFDGSVVADSDGKSFDGVQFFSASHPAGVGSSNTYDNLDTAALSHDSYFAARAAMGSYLDEGGEYSLGIVPTTLVVGPTLERTALEIVGAKSRNDGANVLIDNVMSATASVLISPALIGSYANYWFLCDLSSPMKPLIFQKRQDVVFSAAADPSSESVWLKKKLLYGVDARYGFGYGDPHTAYGSDGTA